MDEAMSDCVRKHYSCVLHRRRGGRRVENSITFTGLCLLKCLESGYPDNLNKKTLHVIIPCFIAIEMNNRVMQSMQSEISRISMNERRSWRV